MSRKLVLGMSMSLDGFIAGPNGEIDWIFANRGEDSTEWVVENVENASLHIMGRASYDVMCSYWPTSNLPMAPGMNNVPKMIFTRSGALQPREGAPEGASAEEKAIWDMWMNPGVGGKDLVSEITELKATDGKPIRAAGGMEFAASLIEHNLVDEYRLIVHPIALGKGLSIFDRLPQPLALKMIDYRVFGSGAIAKVFEPK